MKKLNIVHVVIDQKFIDGAISLFDTDERVENTYIIVDGKQDCIYIKNKKILTVSQDDVIAYINRFDVVILHSLPSVPIKQIWSINSRVKVVWFAWGYDLYEKPYDIIPIKLFGRYTSNFLRKQSLRKFWNFKNVLPYLYVKYYLKSALNRIDFFSGVFPYEIDMIKTKHPEFKAQPLDFYYGSKDFFIPEEPSSEIKHDKYNIIIGNSGNITGNHLDVLDTIKSVGIDRKAKVIIPLSYGGDTKYINLVKTKFERLAPGQIVALDTYIPLNKYLDLVSNCRTAVFAHERQQATDNIFMQLFNGARVFMSETSSTYVYLKSLGIKIYSLQNELHLFNIEMKDEDILTNRKILSSSYSPSQLISRVVNINNILIKAINN